MKRRLLSFIALLSFFNGYGQLTSNYPASNFTIQQGTYTDLGTNGTVITTTGSDNSLSAAEPIGFTFTYNGTAYTDFILSTNGYIKLGTTPPSSASLVYAGPNSPTGGVFNSTNAADQNILVPFGFDLTGATGAEYRVFTDGAPGSRTCTIQFKNLTENTSTIPTQYSNINFQVILYETTNVIDFVYGPWTGTTNPSNAKWAFVGLRGTSNAANQIVSITKGSVTAWASAIAANGNYAVGTNSFNFGNPPTRPAPSAGLTYKFVPVYPNDLAVTAVYTLGKLPKPYVTPHYVRAKVRNNGSATQTNFTVTLNVTGANPFTDNQVIASLAPGADVFVTFAGFTPTVNGSQVITVSVPSDDNDFNISGIYGQLVNDDVYSYADPLLPTAGGVGFTGATGQFCAKFPYSGVSNTINQLGVNFSGGGIPLQVGIWGQNPTTGGPGALLWSSSTFTSVSGLNTIPVNPPVPVSDTFFCGVLQTTSNNASFGYQNENPIRDNTFFYGALNSTSWTDFAASSSNFRFMVEPRFQSPDDMGMTSVDYPCKILPLGQANIFPIASAFNYGLLAQNNVPVTMEIYDNLGTVVYNSTGYVNAILPNTTEPVTFPTTFAPTTAGNYTIKTWSVLPGDASPINDTSSSTLLVVDQSAITNAGNRLQFDGTNDFISIADNPSINPTAAITVEAWVSIGATGSLRTIISKDADATTRSYNLSINSGGSPEFSVQTVNGLMTAASTVPLTTGTWAHVAATYDGTNITIYVNGEQTGTVLHSGSITNNTSPLFIGKTGPSLAFYNGSLDEVKIWSVARTASQIRQNMHTKFPDFSQPDLVVNLHLDEGLGSNLTADASGNCNSGTLVNMDVQNTPLTTWLPSNMPFGSPVVAEQTISGSGPVTFTGANLTLDFANFTGSDVYTVHYFNGAPQGTQPVVTNVNPGTWVIYRSGNGTFTNVDATYEVQGSLLPVSASDVKLYTRSNGSGTAWTLAQNAASAINYTPGTATFPITSPTQFNQQFTIGFTNFPLSVKLLSINAEANKADAIVTWETTNEQDMSRYVVERSEDGATFTAVGTVQAKGRKEGTNTYSYTDLNARSIKQTLHYRLKMEETDGSGSTSPVVTVHFNSKGADVLKVQPNPFTSDLNISYTATSAGIVNIAIINLQGALVYQQETVVKAGLNQMTIQPGVAMADGVYMLQISDRQNMMTEKIIKK